MNYLVGLLSFGLALAAYLYKKKQDKTLAAIEQIAYFREKIIFEWDKVQEAIKDKDKKYWFSRIAMSNYEIDSIRKEKSRNFDNQLSIFFNNSGPDPDVWVDGAMLKKQIYLLNMLEEFSLKVNHFGTREHSALSSVHSAFVEIIEKNAIALLYIRNISASNPIYGTILSLYSSWKGKVGTSSYAKKLKNFGFITDEQFQKILKAQREGVKK